MEVGEKLEDGSTGRMAAGTQAQARAFDAKNKMTLAPTQRQFWLSGEEFHLNNLVF